MARIVEHVNGDHFSFIDAEASRLEKKYSMPIELGGPIPSELNANGWVYILSNPFMPGLLKIGMTTVSPQTRAKELSSGTGVPDKFVVEMSYFSEDPRGNEAVIHDALAEYRVSSNREFFKCSLALADEICREVCLCEESTTLDELANNYAAICIDKPVKVDLHEWFEEFGVSCVGPRSNVAKLIFELGCNRLDEINRDGISLLIESGQARGVMTENSQSFLAHKEDVHIMQMESGIYGPRKPGGINGAF